MPLMPLMPPPARPDAACTRRRLLLGASALLATLGDRTHAQAQAPSGVAAPALVLRDDDAALVPFNHRAGDDELADLKRRLAQTRWPEAETLPGWAQGVPLASMQALVRHWQGDASSGGYDWRRCEAAMAAWPQFKTRIDGLGVHFMHVRSRHPNALPIMLTHGWPSTFLLFQDVIGPLTDPVAHGGDAADAFDVVIPSLPGFGFSDRPGAAGWNAARTARAWAVLMARLGYGRYVAQGGDWGAFVTTAMAQQQATGLAAIHLNFAQTIPDRIPPKSRLTPDQTKAVAAWKAFRETGSAYLQVQATRPQTIGYALLDSPVALAAWIYDIYDSGSGRTGKPEQRIPLDRMLDEITLYWLSATGASSARLYQEQAKAGATTPAACRCRWA
ncbi:epoxide hydrolase family protein [Variovorax sp. KK3]|uniref:epoxide hydrolase family protein n=1 Tax=Variovorax sp. KK3 TaxID=1855728 RepID=UPI001C4E2423|nr:epoxide hydrolase [Variovorax sp. KK3]